jgi:hypothetical protein
MPAGQALDDIEGTDIDEGHGVLLGLATVPAMRAGVSSIRPVRGAVKPSIPRPRSKDKPGGRCGLRRRATLMLLLAGSELHAFSCAHAPQLAADASAAMRPASTPAAGREPRPAVP